MAIVSGFAVFFILWWIVLFAVLPWGVRSADEAGEVVEQGHAASAPVKPQLARKFAITTVVSAVIFAGLYAVVASGAVALDDIPFLPRFESYSTK